MIAFKLLAEITPVEDFLYPIPNDYKKDAEALKGRGMDRNKNSLLWGLSYDVGLVAYLYGTASPITWGWPSPWLGNGYDLGSNWPFEY